MLAAAATCPLRLLDLRDPDAAALLRTIIMPDLLQPEDVEKGMTPRKARLIYNEPRTLGLLATLVSCVRRIAWEDLLAARGLPEYERLLEMVVYTVQTMCLMLACPFYICKCCDGPGRCVAIKEAAKRWACALARFRLHLGVCASAVAYWRRLY